MSSTQVVAEPSTPTSLKQVLLTDAATCTGFGVLLGVGAHTLSPVLGLPAPLLRYAGLSLFPVAGFMAFVALKALRNPAPTWGVVLGNTAWILASLWLAVGGLGAPTLLGRVFLVAQALVVVVFCTQEARGALKLKAG